MYVLTIPKSLLGGIYKITSDKYNKTAISADNVIDTFEIKENRRVSNEGDNIILIKLNKSNLSDKDLDQRNNIALNPVTSSQYYNLPLNRLQKSHIGPIPIAQIPLLLDD